MVAELQTPFSDAQLELLKLFNTPLDKEDLSELKQILLDFKFRKLQQVIERDVEAKGYNSKDFIEMEKGHQRTPYQSNRR